MSRSKKRYSIFCENGPIRKNMGVGAIMIPGENGKGTVWVLVKGKIYKNGWFRYFLNGKEGKSGPYRWTNLTGKPQEEAEGIIRKLNIKLLDSIHPTKSNESPMDERFTHYMEMSRNVRLVRREEPPSEPHTIILGGNIGVGRIAPTNPPATNDPLTEL